jgi:hypothetical protein
MSFTVSSETGVGRNARTERREAIASSTIAVRALSAFVHAQDRLREGRNA